MLPESFALSDAEAAQISKHLDQNDGVVLCDGSPGSFDQHGRLRIEPLLPKYFPPTPSSERFFVASHSQSTPHDGDITLYGKHRLTATPDLAWAQWIPGKIKITPEVQVPLETRTRVHRFKLGKARLVAFERNIGYHMSEDLKQSGGNEVLESPVDMDAKLSAPAHVYNLRTQKYLGRTDHIRFTLDPWQPATFALLNEAVPEQELLQTLAR